MVYALLILSVLCGITLSFIFGKQKKLAKQLLIGSAGVLLGIVVLDIFPEVFRRGGKVIGLWILAGVFLQLILESLTKGFEHGHFHHHEDKENIFPIALILGLFIHAFIEGIPLSETPDTITPYLEGIFIHNIPISFVMGIFLLRSEFNKKTGIFVVTLFALASPMGMLLGRYFDPRWQVFFLAIVSGIFLHISSVIIFEQDKNHKLNLEKLILVLIGVIIAYLAVHQG